MKYVIFFPNEPMFSCKMKKSNFRSYNIIESWSGEVIWVINIITIEFYCYLWRQCRRSTDSVNVALGNRGMTVRLRDNEIGKSGEPWCICNWMSFTLPFVLVPVFFLPYSGGYHLERGGMLLHDAVGIKCNKSATTENLGSGVKYVDDCVCVIWLNMTTPNWWKEKSWYIIIIIYHFR